MPLRVVRAPAATIAGVTGVILAGGESSRMGSNKALLPYRGGRFIESIHRQLSGLFDEVLVVTNAPEQFAFLRCRMVSDIYRDMGALAGLHAGLVNSHTPHIFAVACDMPYLNDSLIRALVARRHQGDVIIPESDDGLEPLHAVYCRSCLPAMETALEAGKRRLVSFFPEIRATIVPGDAVRFVDPDLDSFRNINTPADYYDLRDEERVGCAITPVGRKPASSRQ
ncbi:MAG: molybdenum cofactor guanylyltransferase [Desulfuromonadaceae bacterium]